MIDKKTSKQIDNNFSKRESVALNIYSSIINGIFDKTGNNHWYTDDIADLTEQYTSTFMERFIKEGTNSNRPFKIGDLVVENQIVGVVVELQNEGILKVIGAASTKMHFNESMCRKATSDEALSINARWREQGLYYDINTNKLRPYK